MSTVIVVESPAKARKIQNYFKDENIKVTSSQGHIYDLPKEKISIDIENNFKPNYRPIRGKEKIIKSLRDLSKSDRVLLAADDDREGDAIAWHCGKVMKMKFNEKNRIIFHEISKKAVQKSIQNVHRLNMNSVNAQQARRIIDRLVGYSLSPCLWKHIQTKKMGLSAGRVQSTLLKILKEHEDKINNFEPEYSYDFNGDFHFEQNKIQCELLFSLDEIEPLQIMNQLKKNRVYELKSSKVSEEKKYPGHPFITSSLQQSAQSELGFPVKMTMNIAQKLYENGKITYMRTDSTYISEDFQKTIERKILNEYSDQYYQKYSAKKKKIKGAQEAHECIRPTDINHRLTDKWSEQEKKLYDLILKKTMISHMKPAIYDVLTIDLVNQELKEIGIFRGKHKILHFDGFLRYTQKEFQKGEQFKITDQTLFELQQCLCKDMETNPPQYYNESTIVKKLESSGIGRPSTYATIIDTILNRNYTLVTTLPEKKIEIDTILLDKQNKITEEKREQKLNPQKNRILLTDLGKEVLQYLINNFSNIINVEFTSAVEEDLDKIAEGSIDWIHVIHKVYNSFSKDVEIQMNLKTNRPMIMKSSDRNIGKYKGHDVVIKEGKYGPYLSYQNKNMNLKYILKKKDKNSLTMKDIKDLIDYPMKMGTYKKKDICIHIGPYGKYMKYDNKNFRITQKDKYSFDELKKHLE